MRNKMFFMMGLVICIHHCNAQRAFTDEQLKKELPKKEIKYKLFKQGFVLSDTSVISTDAVYVNTSEESVRENYQIIKTVKSYVFMRFFSDGRLFVSFAYLNYPSIKEFNDLSYGKCGHYIIQDGKIKIELYMNRQHGIMYMFAKPVSNGLQFYKTSGRGIGQILKVSKGTDEGFYKKDYTKLNN